MKSFMTPPKNRRNIERIRRRFASVSKYITPLLSILVLCAFFYLIFIKFEFFNIKNMEVSGIQSFVSEIDLRELAKSRSYGKNIFVFSAKDLERSLSADFQGAKKIFVSKKLPSTIKIQVVERKPLAVIRKSSNDTHFLIDEDGYVLGQIDASVNTFPVISYEGEIEVGYFLDKKTISVYFQLLSSLDSEKISASSMSIHSNYISLFTSKNVEVLIGMYKDIKDSVVLLGKLLSQMASEGKDVKRVDLRYDKVIVSYR